MLRNKLENDTILIIQKRGINVKDGFIKVAAGTPHIKVADCSYNQEQIIQEIRKAAAAGVQLLVQDPVPQFVSTGEPQPAEEPVLK